MRQSRSGRLIRWSSTEFSSRRTRLHSTSAPRTISDPTDTGRGNHSPPVTAVLPLLARDIADKESGLRLAKDPLTGTAHNEVEAPAPHTHPGRAP